MPAHGFTVRPAAPTDVPAIAELIHGLAEYEQLTADCRPNEALLHEHLFGDRPYAEVVLAEVDRRPVGFALFFHNYSTFLSKPGMYLEDLFVLPEHRGGGIGKALLQHVVSVAAERKCGRVEWAVLDWNQPAIDFYTNAFGARPVDGWTVYRLTEDRIRG